ALDRNVRVEIIAHAASQRAGVMTGAAKIEIRIGDIDIRLRARRHCGRRKQKGGASPPSKFHVHYDSPSEPAVTSFSRLFTTQTSRRRNASRPRTRSRAASTQAPAS